MTTNPNYYYEPSTIKNLLHTSIDSVVSNTHIVETRYELHHVREKCQ